MAAGWRVSARALIPASIRRSIADPKTRAVRPVPASPEEMATTWQWTLRPAGGGRGTRLVARQRYSYPRRQSVL